MSQSTNLEHIGGGGAVIAPAKKPQQAAQAYSQHFDADHDGGELVEEPDYEQPIRDAEEYGSGEVGPEVAHGTTTTGKVTVSKSGGGRTYDDIMASPAIHSNDEEDLMLMTPSTTKFN